jgi:putative acyl-CoA dehydrogenase
MAFATHAVFNQPEPLVDVNLFEANRPLQDALRFHAPGLDTSGLHALGALLGTAEMQTHARLANVHAPQLRSHDRFGRRIDEVEFHPSYHALMRAATAAGLHGTPLCARAAGQRSCAPAARRRLHAVHPSSSPRCCVPSP